MIPETIERIKNSERAVSPVIGVILMVAITVILAAVIAAFVLGFGADQDSAPQATWSVSEAENSVTFNHQGGDAVDGEQLSLVFTDVAETPVEHSLDGSNEGSLTGGSSTTFDLSGGAEIEDGIEVSLVWTQPGGDDTSVLRTYTLSEQD